MTMLKSFVSSAKYSKSIFSNMIIRQYPHSALQDSQEKTKSEVTKNILNLYLEAIQSNIAPASIASLFSKSVDFYIPGDNEGVSWAGRRQGRIGVTHFIQDLRKNIELVDFTIRSILVDGEEAVALGALKSRVHRTGELIESEFAIEFVVQNALIVRYRLYEDSFAVAQAVN